MGRNLHIVNMNPQPPRDHSRPYAFFLFGAIFGCIAYYMYIHFSQEEYSRTVFGWLLFPIQFPILWMFGGLELNDFEAILVMFVPLAILYGYVFWCFQKSPGVAFLLFATFAVGCWLWIEGLIPDKPFKLLFWPVEFIGEIMHESEFANRPIGIASACLIVAFSYTAYLSGIYHVFVLFKKQPDPALNQTAQPILACPHCNKTLSQPQGVTYAEMNCPHCTRPVVYTTQP